MPGVLVESTASSPHVFFPFESSLFPDSSNGGLEASASPRGADFAPLSPHSPMSLAGQYTHLDLLASSPPSPSSLRGRDLNHRLLPKSNLGLSSGHVHEYGCDCSSEFAGVPIPSPRKPMYNSASSVDSIVGSPLLPDGSGVGSPIFSDAFSALHKFLPSNKNDDEAWPTDGLPTMDAYSCDDFRMYEFKVRRCMRGRSHDWTECPFAHPGEKARRRDPRRIHYSGTACPDFRKGTCKRGDACEYAHGVFECWLHPARYRTQPCKDGRACRRRVCFFAHTVEQLRILPSVSSASASSSPSAVDGQCKMSPGESSFRYEALNGVDSASKDEKSLNAPGILHKSSEPSSGYGLSSPAASLSQSIHGGSALLSPPISPSTSPPMSPEGFWPRKIASVNPHLQASLQSPLSSVPGHRRHLNRLQTMPTISIPQDLSDVYSDGAVYEDMSFSLPASVHMHSSHLGVGEIMHSLQALQLRSRVAEIQKSASTPSSPQNMKYVTAQQPSLRQCLYPPIPAASTTPDAMWAISSLTATEDDPPHRVESGRDLRAKIYGKIGKDNGVGSSEDPDLGWVNELVK